MFGVVLIERPNVLEQLAVTLVGETLDEPVNCWVEKALVLLVGQVLVALLDYVVVEFEHVLNHEEQVVLVGRIERVSHSRQIGASVGSTERLSDTTDHLGETDQV